MSTVAIRPLDTRLVAAALGLQVADFLTTAVALSRGGHETMAIAAASLVVAGWLGLLLIPAIGLAVQLVVLRLMPRRVLRVGWAMVLAVAAVPVLSNLSVLGQLP